MYCDVNYSKLEDGLKSKLLKFVSSNKFVKYLVQIKHPFKIGNRYDANNIN